MNSLSILRTNTGYQLDKLVAEKLPPRQAQTLLFCANGLTEKEIAQLMNCSAKNIAQMKSVLFLKLKAKATPDLIMRAFQSHYLRFLSIFAAAFLAVGAQNVTDNHQSLARFARTRSSQTSRTQRENTNNKLFWIA